MLLSNKAILPILWEMFPGHPNLLACYRSPDQFGSDAYVRKPTSGREGCNVRIVEAGKTIAESDGNYGDGDYIYQEYAPPPCFQGSFYPNIGSWIVGGTAHGMGIREDDNLIIGNLSRFVPHFFTEE
jgi:glutathionylspermidine synthase